MATEVSAPITASDLTERSRRGLAEAEAVLERIERAGSDRATVLEPYDQAWLLAQTVGVEAGLMKEVHPDREVRAAAEAMAREVTRFHTRFQHSRALYDALGRVEPADDGERRLIQVVRDEMRRAGVELDEAGRRRVLAMRERLTDLGLTFQRDHRDDVRAVELRPEQLAGMPADYVNDHPAGATGTVRITTDYPDYIPFMSYADDERARHDLHRQFQNRAVPANLEVLTAMIRTKHELAGLLGYRSWAEYQTEDTIAGSAGGVRSFLQEVAEIARERVRRESERLLARKRERGGDAKRIGDWELAYLQEKVKAEEIGSDARETRPYLEYRAVRQAILDLSSELFGLEFSRSSEPPWHPSVETFEVAIDGRHSGRISLDMHPRAGKYKHAANFGYRPGAAGRQRTHSVLVCNFPDPNTVQGPALMDHREVVTYFHEFGHLVHGLARRNVPFVRLSRTEGDFMEAPSTFLEDWIFDFNVLTRFAKHVDTAAPIPEDLVQRLRAARNFGRAIRTRQMLARSRLSLALHDGTRPGADPRVLEREINERYGLFERIPGTSSPASWEHMNSDAYSAAYYTYLWSQTIAEDLHTAFDGDLMNTAVSRRYRDKILAPGGTKPAAELVRDFLGRPYDLRAFKEWVAGRD